MLRQQVRVPADAEPGTIEVRGTMHYLVCDESMCDPPATLDFAAVLTVEAGPARDDRVTAWVDAAGEDGEGGESAAAAGADPASKGGLAVTLAAC